MSIVLNAIITLSAFAAAAGSALIFAHRKLPTARIDLIECIDALLPQTQCGECGHAGCRPYAKAIANGEPINRCPPGGQRTIAALADLMNLPSLPLDGITKAATVAFIREAECIGCTKCIQACPVDAIVGAAKLMHTVIADECTGCDLCVEPCPVDCIEMRPLIENENPFSQRERIETRAHYRERFVAHNARIARETEEHLFRRTQRQQQVRLKNSAAAEIAAKPEPVKTKQDEIREAIARAKARKSTLPSNREP